MTPVRSVLFASAISLAAGAAFAGNQDQVFERLDTNNDDMIGAQEDAMRAYNSPSGSLFSSFDVDADGSISWQEAQLDRDLAYVFGTVDSDRSNALTPDEFNNAVALVASDSAPGRG
jgi:hypothetical protein